MDTVVHFEIPVDDMDRAKKFYSIFGWQLDDMPEVGYVCIRTVEESNKQMPTKDTFGAINGGMMKRTEQVKSPVITINVNSIDDYVKKVISLGGSVVMEKKEIKEIGYYAYITDTEGNIIGLWEDLHK